MTSKQACVSMLGIILVVVFQPYKKKRINNTGSYTCNIPRCTSLSALWSVQCHKCHNEYDRTSSRRPNDHDPMPHRYRVVQLMHFGHPIVVVDQQFTVHVRTNGLHILLPQTKKGQKRTKKDSQEQPRTKKWAPKTHTQKKKSSPPKKEKTCFHQCTCTCKRVTV